MTLADNEFPHPDTDETKIARRDSSVSEFPRMAPHDHARSDEDTAQLAGLGDGWVTLAEAAERLGKSQGSIRRKLKSGEITGQLVFDPKIGVKRWLVDAAALSGSVEDLTVPEPEIARDEPRSRSSPDPSRESSPGSTILVPIEAIDRLEEAWARLRDAVARAEIAERKFEFEQERRMEAEKTRDLLRETLDAEHRVAERVAELETHRRIEAEKERDRLRALLGAQEPKSFWKRLRD